MRLRARLAFPSRLHALGGVAALASALLLSACSPGFTGYTHSTSFSDEGSGVLRISDALGGDYSKTNQEIRRMQKEGVLFVVDGRCASACTIVLDHGYPHVCWTDRAEFLFHAAYPRRGGTKETASIATLLMAAKLPSYVREQLPPPNEWTRWTYHSLKAEDLPVSGHCDNNERYAKMEKDADGKWVSRYDGTLGVAARPAEVSDEQYLENIQESVRRHPTLKAGILETARGLRPHLIEDIDLIDQEFTSQALRGDT